jgi:hypothetical protein
MTHVYSNIYNSQGRVKPPSDKALVGLASSIDTVDNLWLIDDYMVLYYSIYGWLSYG